jgi:hypothetical protein
MSFSLLPRDLVVRVAIELFAAEGHVRSLLRLRAIDRTTRDLLSPSIEPDADAQDSQGGEVSFLWAGLSLLALDGGRAGDFFFPSLFRIGSSTMDLLCLFSEQRGISSREQKSGLGRLFAGPMGRVSAGDGSRVSTFSNAIDRIHRLVDQVAPSEHLLAAQSLLRRMGGLRLSPSFPDDTDITKVRAAIELEFLGHDDLLIQCIFVNEHLAIFVGGVCILPLEHMYRRPGAAPQNDRLRLNTTAIFASFDGLDGLCEELGVVRLERSLFALLLVATAYALLEPLLPPASAHRRSLGSALYFHFLLPWCRNDSHDHFWLVDDELLEMVSPFFGTDIRTTFEQLSGMI